MRVFCTSQLERSLYFFLAFCEFHISYSVISFLPFMHLLKGPFLRILLLFQQGTVLTFRRWGSEREVFVTRIRIEDRRGGSMGRLYLIQLDGRIYSCRHCRSHLAQCDELVSKVWASTSPILPIICLIWNLWYLLSSLVDKSECFNVTHLIRGLYYTCLTMLLVVPCSVCVVVSLSTRKGLPVQYCVTTYPVLLMSSLVGDIMLQNLV